MCSKNDDVDEKSQFVRNLHWSHQSVDENLHDCKTSEVRWGYFDGIIALHFESCELRCKHHYQVLPLSVASIHGDACRIRAKAESALKACMFATVASFETKFPRCWFANQHSSCYIAGDSSEVEDKRILFSSVLTRSRLGSIKSMEKHQKDPSKTAEIFLRPTPHCDLLYVWIERSLLWRKNIREAA